MPEPHELSTGAGDGWEVADLIAVGVLDAVTGQPPVPISVWRATGPDDPPITPGRLATGLTPRVAAILLAIYTDPGDLVLDAIGDPVVAGVAGAGARRYQRLLPADLIGPPAASTREPTGHATLVLLSWPAHSSAGVDAAHQDVLQLAVRRLASGGHTVAILTPPAGHVYVDHARTLLAAADRVGLGYLQHVVVITGARDDTGAAAGAADGAAPDAQPVPSRREHLDLLVLVLRPGRTR